MPDAPARAHAGFEDRLADFTADRRVLLLGAIAVVIGALAAGVAWLLLQLIALFTNIAFYQRISTQPASPAGHHLGLLVVLVPVAGGLVVGLLARYGSDKIRGHGIPEAIEAILLRGARVEGKVAVLKPVSAALSIGTGGPFGAEGPIIMTGGAFGSLVAQGFHLTAAERKTLLVAGAAAGMAAVFGTPLAALMLAVELLLFEWKPRSVIPVALACVVAAVLRVPLLGAGPVFPVAPHGALPWAVLLGALLVGALAGVLSGVLTRLVYAFEDAFLRLPVHWMWWPALGGLAIGLGGLAEPRALGVGYDVIGQLLAGQLAGMAVLGLLVVKMLIWSSSLGSGTSGGVLAPLLMMGAGLGALLGQGLGDPALWALLGMGAMMAGTMRVPFTGILFTLELTHDWGAALPLLLACVAAYAVTVLALRRSILTEKVARRGHHVVREYGVDPLDMLRIGEAMTREVEALPGSMMAEEAVHLLLAEPNGGPRRHQGYPVVDPRRRVIGVVTRTDALEWQVRGVPKAHLAEMLARDPVLAFPDEPASKAADLMARHKVGRIPVVDPRHGQLVGIVSRSDLLEGRLRRLLEETDRQRLLRADVRVLVARGRRKRKEHEPLARFAPGR